MSNDASIIYYQSHCMCYFPPPPSHSLVPKNLGLFHTPCTSRFARSNCAITTNEYAKKTESSTTIINYYKNYCMMAFFLYSNCDICLNTTGWRLYIEKKNFNRPKKIVCENNFKKYRAQKKWCKKTKLSKKKICAHSPYNVVNYYYWRYLATAKSPLIPPKTHHFFSNFPSLQKRKVKSCIPWILFSKTGGKNIPK